MLELGVVLDPRFRLVMALLWAILFLASAIALWQRRPFTRLAIPVLLLSYAMYQIGLVSLFVLSPVAQRGLPSDLVQYTIVILFTIWALNRPAVQPYFYPDRADESHPTQE